jgi:apolipoprotein D and lipocalin family protein
MRPQPSPAAVPKFLHLGIVIVLAATLGACATARPAAVKKSAPPLRPVRHVDLPRYMGDWRVIANIPYFAEKGCVDSIESYALRPDGVIENWFTYRKESFDAPQKTLRARAHVVDRATNAQWKVTFFGLVSVDYLVIDLDPDYRWAVIGYPSRKLGWIIARERTLPDATYHAILERLKAQGYDPAEFEKVPQVPPRSAGR